MAKRSAPEVNAGSMADIAFLLLIFFLVTTTIESDTGINRKLPPKLPDEIENPPIIKQKNLFTVDVNKFNQILVEEEEMPLKDLRAATIAFLDNGGGKKADGVEPCNYCRGKRDPESSDNPEKAVVSLKNSRETNYETYIAIQNEIVAAYKFLRDRESKRLFNIPYAELKQAYKDAPKDSDERTELAKKVDEVENLYPEKFSEAESD